MTTNWIEFNQVHSNAFPLLVLDIRTTSSAPKNSKIITVPGLAGGHDDGIEEDPKGFEVDVCIAATESLNLQDIRDLINSWLYTKELADFRTGREPNRIYEARHIGAIEWNPTGNAFLIATISFLAPNPRSRSYSQTTLAMSATGTTVINNPGNAEAYPIFKATVNAPITSLAFIKENKYIAIGFPDNIELPTIPREEYVLRDGLESTQGWSTTNYIDGGTVTGAFQSSGQGFVVSDYGEGTEWHGPAIVKALDATAQDFRAEINFSLRSSNRDQIGRLEMYVLDTTDSIIAKIAMKDVLKNEEKNMGEIRVGNKVTGTYLMSGERTGAKYAWNDIDGKMWIERKGTQWVGHIGKREPNGTYSARQTVRLETELFSDEAAKIVFHAAQYGTNPPVQFTTFGELFVKKFNPVTEFEIPIIADAGDEIVIYNDPFKILKNGELYMQDYDPVSEIFKLSPGENVIMHTPANAVDAEVTFEERFL
jgi:predicted phage tail component-like protein